MRPSAIDFAARQWPAQSTPGDLTRAGGGSGARGGGLDSLLLWALAGFVLALAALLALGRGHWVEYLYPAGGLGFGVLFYWRRKDWLVGLTMWLWMLSPMVRRIVDLEAGWNELSPVLVTPLAVTAISALTLPRRLHLLAQTGSFPMGLAMLAALLGYVIGLPSAGIVASTYAFGTWVIPIFFGLQLYLDWRSYPDYRHVITRVFSIAIPLLGLYGIWQFVNPPAWDRNWMVLSGMNSIGEPEPFLVRVFGTLNSPGTFSVFMLTGLLLLMAVQASTLKRLTLAPGYIAFLLCLVRSAWIGWVFGTGITFTFLPQRSRVRLLMGFAILTLLLIPVLAIEPIRDRVVDRFISFTDLSQDQSLEARAHFSAIILGAIADNPLGTGLGSTSGGARVGGVGVSVFDNGLLEIFYTLGWFAGLLFMIGSVSALLLALANGWRLPNLFERVLATVPMGIIPLLLSFNVLVGASGVLFWGIAGLSLAGSRWVSEFPDAAA